MSPWALGAKDSWTLTDWFENIYARTAGAEKYNQLFSGELDFTDQSVKDALTMMTELLNNETVVGGIDGALGTGFVDGIGQVFSANAQAHMYMEGGFVGGIALADVNPNLKPGETIDFFPFPTIEESVGDPLVGGGDITAAFVNNEDVAKLVEYLASPEAGKIWVSTGAIVSPNKGVTADAYPNELVQKEAEQVARRGGVRVRRLGPAAGCARRGLGHAAPDRPQEPGLGRLRAPVASSSRRRTRSRVSPRGYRHRRE